MKKTLCLWASLLSVQSASLYVEEQASILRFQQEMSDVCSYSTIKNHLIFENLALNPLLSLQEQWCGQCRKVLIWLNP